MVQRSILNPWHPRRETPLKMILMYQCFQAPMKYLAWTGFPIKFFMNNYKKEKENSDTVRT